MNDYLKRNIIEEVSSEKAEYVSPFFAMQRKNKIRPILDLRHLNFHLETEHFKIEGLQTAFSMIRKEDFFTKIDLKDAYLKIALHEENKKYFQFQWNGKYYQFTRMSFGLSIAPRIFTKII